MKFAILCCQSTYILWTVRWLIAEFQGFSRIIKYLCTIKSRSTETTIDPGGAIGFFRWLYSYVCETCEKIIVIASQTFVFKKGKRSETIFSLRSKIPFQVGVENGATPRPIYVSTAKVVQYYQMDKKF